jgi:hypothetical protein
MNVRFIFFDKEKWSIYATLNTCIPLLLLYLFNYEFDIKNLTISSLISMMKGDLISKIIFYIFLSFLFYKREKEYIYINSLFILSIIIIHYVPYENKFQMDILNNNINIHIFRMIILIWFLVFIKKLIYDL